MLLRRKETTMSDGVNFIDRLLRPAYGIGDNGAAHIATTEKNEGSSKEFERNHGTDWFAKAVNTPTC